MHVFVQRFRKDITGIFWLGVGVFVTLALISFNPGDPSFNSTGRQTYSDNWCGYFGSFLADLLYQGFGISAWIAALGAFRLSRKGFTGQEVSFRTVRTLWALLLLATASSLLGLYFPESKIFDGQILVGGFFGQLFSSQLGSVFNRVGAGVVLWSAAGILMVFYTEKSLPETAQGIKQSLKRVLERIQAWQDERTAQKAERESAAPAPTTVSASVVKSAPEVADNESVTETLPAVQKLFKLPTIAIKESPKKKLKIGQKITRVENWNIPTPSLLRDPVGPKTKIDEKEIKNITRVLEDKLAQFDVRGKVVGVRTGPAVSLFEFKPDADVKISKITELEDDISLALASESIRIIAPLPGRDVVGIETSNPSREEVYFKEAIADSEFWNEKFGLPVSLGKQVDGSPRVVDLRKMPHLMVAGTTGSGKSVFVVSLITGLLFRHSPKTLRLILIDPKQVDLAAFHKIPHLLMPPIYEPAKAVNALRWAIHEMEKRYRSMSKFNARGLEEFNNKVAAIGKEEQDEHTRFNQEHEETVRTKTYYHNPLPFIVIVVEEFGDLMAVDSKNVENAVVRLAQKARACGIHLVLAMQSPRRDVVTGLIKTNIPGRISFKVASKVDSRIILDDSGADRLLANGDMLFLAPGVSKPQRHHGPWLAENEITAVTEFWANQAEPQFDMDAVKTVENSGTEGSGDAEGPDEFSADSEERYDEILGYVSELKEVSASLLQRKFRLGYPRAARLIEIFEREGVVGPANGSKPRQVLLGRQP